ncbi:MAG: methyltransferase domain-containing protein [Deltaproteobacteria bacterium]|nr:methyltransferase domain-containing protein [Deltaproteobacteria bacterium]
MTSFMSTQEIASYYEGKTQAILRRYGPGPRVHYHTGFVDEPQPPTAPVQVLRQSLVAAQERMLCHAAAVWRAQATLCGDVLDVGCGLGGGSIFWAQEFGAQVTAVTVAPSHVAWVKRFAAQAGVASRIRPLVCDALEVPGESCFDAVVAVDSSGYLPREAWFRRLASLLRPGGHVFLTDCFLGRPEYEEPFNHYWHTRIGTTTEYLTAAREVGLREELADDISLRTEHFWAMTQALTQAEAQEKELSRADEAKFAASLSAHTLVRQGLLDGGLRYALMSFSKSR